MKLYIFIRDCGDGSYYPHYTTDYNTIQELERMAESDELDFESGFVDGDGFHYETINVPEGSTEESLGVRFYKN